MQKSVFKRRFFMPVKTWLHEPLQIKKPMKYNYLIAYDIRHAKRLRRVHYYMSKRATALQKSVFLIKETPSAVNAISSGVLALADTNEDDIRLYPIQQMDKVWVAGRQAEKLQGLYGAAKISVKKSLAKKVLSALFGSGA